MRFRLSNTCNAAVAFSCATAEELRDSALTALADYRETHGARDRFLELHVWSRDEWMAPIRNGAPVRVFVGDVNRPVDDWYHVWEWCAVAVEWDARLSAGIRQAVSDAFPPAELQDPDRG